MDSVCPDCGALIWYLERAEKSKGKCVLKVSICCKKGKITLPFMIEPPPLIRSLFNGAHPKSSTFLSNIRSYNNMFSFTSLGGKIDSGSGHGPPHFTISGQNYHRIGSLIPNSGQSPKFAQLYIYDTENEISNRLSHFSSLDSQNPIDSILAKEILNVMDDHNRLVQSFRMVRDYIQSEQAVPVSLRLFRNRQHDPRTYNMPQIDEVAALIVGDIGDGEDGRDIVVRERGGYLQRQNQSKIRADFLAGIEEAVSRGDIVASSIGARIVLPSSFTGGRRYMFNNCQDAMSVSKKFGYPDLFLTFTCNPKWPEIQRHMNKSRNYPIYRPDVTCRVFQIKLDQMMADFRKGHFFGRVVASMYTIEFQKRGLPHAHILLWLDSRDRLQSPESIDSVICAELPDKNLFPKLYSAAHVNIEFCNKSNCIKYLFKYINKGVDRVTATLQSRDDECIDEIQQYYDCRFLSPSESIWRIFAFKIHERHPAVIRLTFHEEGKQSIIFRDSSNLTSVLRHNKKKATMFLAWMEANKKYPQGRHLTYGQFPSLFTYDSDGHFWKPRKRGFAVGRLSYIPHSNRDLFYLRLLLNVQVGCTSYEDLKTVNGNIHDSYRDACGALKLLEDDREFIAAIVEVANLGSGVSIRKMFARLLMSNTMSDPLRVWENLFDVLVEGILYHRRRALNDPDLVISSEDLKQLCLLDIDNFLRENGKCLDDYKCMPKLLVPNNGRFNNILVENEYKYDLDEMNRLHVEHMSNLNSDQLDAYHQILQTVDNGVGSMFFVYGYGGTGKTYLWKTISYKLRSEGKIVLNVASSGIASILLPGGRTAHSQFGLPLSLSKESCCNIKLKSKKAELLSMTSLIIWDEAPMINKFAFEAFERTLRDVMGDIDKKNANLLFGGKTVVFGGDFRQILPVVPKGSRADIVNATINSSYLWRKCRVLTLSKNMRLQSSFDHIEKEKLASFAEWILGIGDGKIGTFDDGDMVVDIPLGILVSCETNPIGDIVNLIYPELLKNMFVPNFFEDRAILAPTLEIVEQINDYVLSLIPSSSKEYLSCDYVSKCDDDTLIDHRWITTEFLNEIKCSGLPNYRLVLKVGVPIMLLRNVDVSSGLCNGTRLIVTYLGSNVIGAQIVSGRNIGNVVFIPRMRLMPSDSNVSINFYRLQFPLCVCFAMSINKSQGQTLGHVGLFLPRSVFTHGQLYVAVSRVKTRSGLKILVTDDNERSKNSTVNVVYPEVFQKM
ncbi:hypothetical protein TSUD_413210 [Trifolium subterraneum]|uniref:ATP-dependent DNA helicase n=1 Tax=Trifolium subterraneum TaxID=3900 RepID=A0A2Z6PIV1_TRISU|nr:hypothetical protein TSUD_413210 [Trifolium subterraneum]